MRARPSILTRVMTTELHLEDTITAIATPSGEGGVAIVRVSGPESLRIADEVFRGHGERPSGRPSHVILHGCVVSGSDTLDEVFLMIMRAPHSYTGEDVVEIQGHGGPVTARRILRRVLDAGARMAEPGEFTRRAFLNGRMDLLQAEAVLDLIRSRTDRAAAAAMEQLEGALSKKLSAIYDALITAAADVEATLDFPEEELPAETVPEIAARTAAIGRDMDALLATWEEGHLLREGALCVITGKTNVGKSTLLNALLGRHRAIVSPRHGTTRDTIEESVVVDGNLLRIVDTAGLRDSDCEIELEGMRRTRDLIGKADVRIHVVDASVEMDEVERAHVRELNPERSVVVLNKTDLGLLVSRAEISGRCVVEASLLNGKGVTETRSAIVDLLSSGVDVHAPPHAAISERHRNELDAARAEVGKANELLAAGREDAAALVAQHLRAALESVGRITGRVYGEELLTSVFSRFCIGK